MVPRKFLECSNSPTPAQSESSSERSLSEPDLQSASSGTSNQAVVIHKPLSPGCYRQLEGFFGRRVILGGKDGSVLKASLKELFHALGVSQGWLKGSTAHVWNTASKDAVHKDIDFQYCPPPEYDQDLLVAVRERLATFLQRVFSAQHCAPTQKRPVAHALLKNWVFFLPNQANTRHRVLFSLGSSDRPGCSKIDFNCSRSQALSNDTSNHSKALWFNLEAKTAEEQGSVCDALRKWLNNESLLWFVPEIEGGLKRLHKRLVQASTQSPNVLLLQKNIAQHYLQKAAKSEKIRLMFDLLEANTGNYTLGNQRFTRNLAVFWSALLAFAQGLIENKELCHPAPEIVAPTPEKEISPAELVLEMLCGAPYTSEKLAQLSKSLHALAQPHTRTPAQKQHTEPLSLIVRQSRVARHYRPQLSQVLNDWPELDTHLNNLLCLPDVIAPEDLVQRLLKWPDLIATSLAQLNDLFAPNLDALLQTPDSDLRARGVDLLAWIKQEPPGNVRFAGDLIPDKKRASPAARERNFLVKTIQEALKANPEASYAQVLQTLERINLGPACFNALLPDLAAAYNVLTHHPGSSFGHTLPDPAKRFHRFFSIMEQARLASDAGLKEAKVSPEAYDHTLQVLGELMQEVRSLQAKSREFGALLRYLI
ncbi:MAG: hypothetical protein HC848_07495 [Limnobacter sp.]|nr:hypothetical protein [Limnobacter sp.]